MSDQTVFTQIPPDVLADKAPSDPPSLRRRAPARIDIHLRSGECLPMSGSLLHLVAGNSFVVKIEPQSSTANVQIVGEEPHLQAVVSASRVEGGTVPIYHAEFYACPLKLPLPTIVKLHITILDGKPEPCCVTVPIKIWPAYSTMGWWWFFVFLGFLGLRWERTAAHAETYSDIFMAILGDVPYSLGALVIGGLILLPLLRLVSWLILPLFESSENG